MKQVKLSLLYDTNSKSSIITAHHTQYFTATLQGWKHLLKPDKYKDVIMDSLSVMVKEKWIELNVFCIMSNHMHMVWQVQDGYERDAVQRNFLKFVSQTIKRDLIKNHPKVLEQFYVGAKDREYQFWKQNPLSIDLWTKEVFIQKMEYIHNNLPTGRQVLLQRVYAFALKITNIHLRSFIQVV
ncbi:MAG: transposase [Ginsengibacter sp.]